ncbi:MaoC family dehydratase N-terminal domain-containing protein [Thermodesulfobacteriota bacterium]
MATTKITTVEEYVEALQKRPKKVYINEWNACMAGPKFPRPLVAFNTQVTRDSIKHFVDAIGDMNPIFRDRTYAEKTKYGCLIAPPTFLYSIAYGHYPDPPGSAPPEAFYNLYAGDEYEWFSPLSDGEEIDFKTTFPTDIKFKSTKAVEKAAFLYGRHEFTRHMGGTLLATCDFWIVLYKKAEDVRQKPESDQFDKPVYTEDYIKEVYSTQDREVVRGAEPRYWEDVEIGEELPPVVRGPHSATETVAWLIGGIGEFYFCSDRLYRYIFEQCGWGFYDRDWKVHLNFHENMYNTMLAKEHERMTGGIGAQRSSWIDMVLTNWMGDEGFIWKLRSEHRGQGGLGYVYWCKAKVTDKYIKDDRYCVDIECRVEEQKGNVILSGNATVLLPSKEHGPVFYPSPSV